VGEGSEIKVTGGTGEEEVGFYPRFLSANGFDANSNHRRLRLKALHLIDDFD